MPKPNLNGKAIMIAMPGEEHALLGACFIQDAFLKMGANLDVWQIPPSPSVAIPFFSEKIEKHDPKIDVLIIYNSFVEWPERETISLELTKRFKDSLPVIVSDSCSSEVDIQRLRNAGAKFKKLDYLDSEQLAFEVTDALAQHGKTGKSVGG